MKTGIIDVQFDSEDAENGAATSKIGKMTKKVRIKTDVDKMEGKDKKKKRRRQGYPNLAQAQRSKEMGNETDYDSFDEDEGILPTIEGFDPRKRKMEEVSEIRNTRPGICDDCKKKGLNSADEYMQRTFKKYDTKDQHSNGQCIVCQEIGLNFNFLDSNSGSASMTYPRDFYDKFSRETKPPNIDSEPEQTRGSPGLPSIQEESKVSPTKTDPLRTPGENAFEVARKGVLGRLVADSPRRRDALGRHQGSPGRERAGNPFMDSVRRDVPTRYSPYIEKIKKDRYRNDLQYPDDKKKELLVREFQFETPKLDLTGHGDIRNISKRELEFRKDIKYNSSFEPSKFRHLVKNGNRYMEYPLPTLNTYSLEPQEVSDEPECFPYNRGLRGGTIKKDPNPIHRERQELLQNKQDKYSMYAVGSLGLVYGLPEHNKTLTDRSSIPETATSLSLERTSPGNRPLSLLPPLKSKKRPSSYFSYG